MKIREVRVQNLRNFGPEGSAVSFVDTATDQVRPLTVLVGSNGSGKTTVMDLIEGACRFACEELAGSDEKPFAALIRGREGARVEIDHQLWGAAGTNASWPRYTIRFEASSGAGVVRAAHLGQEGPGLSPVLVSDDLMRSTEAAGVLSYFPTHRYLAKPGEGSTISQPTETARHVYRYKPSDRYEGSLEQLWVWQNYLDLETQKEGQLNLLPFIETIQTILGRDQSLSIHKGKVWIERPHLEDRVRIGELPSGEQQVLLIFGEIIRRLRPQAIVMIDELEMSLHPALQRVVLHHLRRLARQHDLQVIVTTHSMEIVSAADTAEIVNLDDMAFVEQKSRSAPEVG